MQSGIQCATGRFLETGEELSQVPVVPAGTMLIDLADVFARHDTAHVLVQDRNGGLLGIVSSNDLRRAMRTHSTGDVTAWHQRVVESLISVTLEHRPSPQQEPSRSSEPDAPGASDGPGASTEPGTSAGPDASTKPHGCDSASEPPAETDQECITVRDGADLVALLMDEDVLLSWNRLEPALARVATDALTSLPTRAHFERRLREEWERATRLGLSLGLIIIDVDHLKEINDRFGHLRGDMVLAAVAQCCQRQLRSYDLVARFAGDEFVALTCGCGVEDIDLPIHRLQQAIRSLELKFNEQPVTPSLSIGASVCADLEGLCPDDLLDAADRCLYECKKHGRDRAYRVELSADGRVSQPVRVDHASVPPDGDF